MEKARYCHIFGMKDAREAYAAFRGERVEDLSYTADGRANCLWDDGARDLLRCAVCGGLVLSQRSEFEGSGDSGMYCDAILVESVEQARQISASHGAGELAELTSLPHLRKDSGREAFWLSRGEGEG